MTRLLSTVALSALVLGAGAPAWAQYAPPAPYGYTGGGTFDSRGMPMTGDIADQLNRGVAERNDAANAVNAANANSYGSSGAPAYAPPPTTTTTTTTWRSISPAYPPSINDAPRTIDNAPPPYPPPAYTQPTFRPAPYPGSYR
jgi:hypothetical protein